jgi:peptidoglycan hydrolase CwlO-like protein
VIVEPEELKQGKEDILELKKKTFEKIEELAEREHDLEDRRRVLIQARKDLENLRVELAEKEAHLTLWEEELRAMGKKLANERAIPLGVPTQAPPQPQKKRKLFGLGRRRKSTSKPS